MKRHLTVGPGELCARLALFLVLVFAGCGDSDSAQSFANCGNSRIDSGETCDDGNLSDSDACTSACQVAACGDGVVESGVEQCDGFLASNINCETFGLAGPGNPVCSSTCEFDVSGCGAAFTATPVRPTATITATPTATGVPTATPTRDVAACGDGLLESDETCETCAADCTPQPCTASGSTVTFETVLAPPPGATVSEAQVQLAYRTNVLILPGSGNDPNVRRRVRGVAQPAPAPILAVNDADYALTVTAVRNAGLSGPIFTIQFDICSGAPAPTVGDFTCIVPECGASLECTCSVRSR